MIITIVVFMLYGVDKQISFCDEVYSYTITNSDMFILQFDEGQWYDRSEIVGKSTHTETDSFDQMIGWVKQDVVHPPLYYICMYFSSMIAGPYFTKWVGLFVNLFFLIGTVIFIWYILVKLFDSSIIASLGMLGYIFNQSTISDAMLIRMYMMFTFFVAGFMYYSLCIITSEKKISGCGIKKWIPDEIGYYIMLILITCGGFYDIVNCI